MEWWIPYVIILGLGALQGWILGTWILRKGEGRKLPHTLLAVLLFAFAYRLSVELLRYAGLGGVDHWTYHLFLEYSWAYGPLIYLYIQAYLRPDFTWTRQTYLHFLPLGVQFLMSNWVKSQNFFWNGKLSSLPPLGAESYVLWVQTPFHFWVFGILILAYGFFSQKTLNHHTQTYRLRDHQLAWLRQILWSYMLLACLVLVFTGIDFFFFDYAFGPAYYRPAIFIPMAALTYWLGLKGATRQPSPVNQLTPIAPAAEPTLLVALRKLMEQEALYQQAGLTVSMVAERLEVKPYQITQVLNRTLDQSFTDFVNEYRVHAFEKLLQQEKYQHYTLSALGLEAGFNSKASFNRVVKKMRGVSPKTLRQTLR